MTSSLYFAASAAQALDWIKTKAIESLDYVPLVSTGKSLIDLFVKHAALPYLNSDTIISNRYLTHVDDTSTLRSLIVALPLIGNVTIALFDLARHFLITRENILSGSNEGLARLLVILAPHSLMHDKELAHDVLRWHPYALRSFGRDIREDREIRHLVTMRKANGFAVELSMGFPRFGSPEEKRDFKDKFAQKVWAQIPPDLKDDLKIQARYYGLTPWTLDAESRKDKALIHKLLDADDAAGKLYPYLHETLQQDPNIGAKSYDAIGFPGFHPDLRQNRDFAEKIVKEFIGNVRHFPELIQDRDFWITILNFEENKTLYSLEFLKHLPENLQEDREIRDLVCKAYVNRLESMKNINTVFLEFNNNQDIFLNREPQFLDAYRNAFISISATTESSHFKRNSFESPLKRLLRDTYIMGPNYDWESYEKGLNQLKALSNRALFSKYFDQFIRPHFIGDQELEEALNAYADRVFGKK